MRKKVGTILSWVLACILVWGLAFFAAIGGAQAQTICVEREGIGKQLASRYKEAQVNLGLANNGSMIEVFASEDGATFTIMVTNPEGTACMIAAGEHWESVPFKLKKDIRYGNPL